jgi:hypothetical protein
MYVIFYRSRLHLCKCIGSWVVSTKQNMNFNCQSPAMFVILVFHKNSLTESCSSFQDLSACKISWSHVHWLKFCIHLRNSNVRHLGMIEATGLELMASRSPSMAYPPCWFHEKLPVGSNLLGGGGVRQTYRQESDTIGLLFPLGRKVGC